MDLIGFRNIPKSKKLDHFTREELIQRHAVMEFELTELIKENYELRSLKITDEQIQLMMAEQLENLRSELFGAKSERYKKPKEKNKPKEPEKSKVKKPSERYPNLPVKVELITMNPAPSCPCCGDLMMDSGMTEDSEQLTVIPKKYEITLQKRTKFRCRCQGTIVTTPVAPRITPGSSYSDEMILDVALTKYCDLIPMERYSAMAARSGVKDLPPHSLIELTHQFADFMSPVYRLIKKGALSSRVLRADETPHRMLEGSDKKSWYLWGFSTTEFCFFECHDTRSGDVASEILLTVVRFWSVMSSRVMARL